MRTPEGSESRSIESSPGDGFRNLKQLKQTLGMAYDLTAAAETGPLIVDQCQEAGQCKLCSCGVSGPLAQAGRHDTSINSTEIRYCHPGAEASCGADLAMQWSCLLQQVEAKVGDGLERLIEFETSAAAVF